MKGTFRAAREAALAYLPAAFAFFFSFFSLTVSFGLLLVFFFSCPLGMLNLLLTPR
jgi:hypothetical protein